MKNYSIMLKPASSLCDLRCRYCFYADVAARRSVRSFGMMQDSVLRRIMENIARSVAPGDHITLMFQGGEPMLAGLDFFRTLTEIADSWPSGISVSYALQTNAMHLDEAWCLFLKKHEFLVGVSHDLLAAQHNAARNLVYSGSKENVRLTMIAGRVLYENGAFFVGEPVQDIYRAVETNFTAMRAAL